MTLSERDRLRALNTILVGGLTTIAGLARIVTSSSVNAKAIWAIRRKANALIKEVKGYDQL